jgi:hypothetical protein
MQNAPGSISRLSHSARLHDRRPMNLFSIRLSNLLSRKQFRPNNYFVMGNQVRQRSVSLSPSPNQSNEPSAKRIRLEPETAAEPLKLHPGHKLYTPGVYLAPMVRIGTREFSVLCCLDWKTHKKSSRYSPDFIFYFSSAYQTTSLRVRRRLGLGTRNCRQSNHRIYKGSWWLVFCPYSFDFFFLGLCRLNLFWLIITIESSGTIQYTKNNGTSSIWQTHPIE